MKTIGLIGGMSWESTVSYYRIINTAVAAEAGLAVAVLIGQFETSGHDHQHEPSAGVSWQRQQG